MRVTPLEIPEVVLVEPRVFGDERGYFTEVWVAPRYQEFGLPGLFLQDNLSRSAHGVIRGLHLQHPHGQGKLVSAVYGEVFDVAVDVRVGSPTFGRWVATTLSESNKHQLYIPPGFAHGLCVTSEFALLSYKCTEVYHPEAELGVCYDDPDIGISWPVEQSLVSTRDRAHPRLKDLDWSRLPSYSSPVASHS
jgi:dTDP-4-dehydrorhamnose 3,5-epimerase